MNWLQKNSQDQQSDTHDLRRDGRLVFRGSANDCYIQLQRRQSQSADWAMKYEGWTISPTIEDWRDHYEWYAPEGQ